MVDPGPRQDAPRGAREQPLTVTELIRVSVRSLDRGVGTVWVEGEVASLARPASGHLYFTLKDRRSSLAAVLWRSDARRLRFALENGQALRCRGRPGIFDRGGKFQLYVNYAEPAGLGAAALALEQLKRKLAAEGIFDTARKRPLPRMPRRIGIVTSRTGAAVRDIIDTVQRRYPVPILVADAAVQGPGAPRHIAAALAAIVRSDDIDVVIVGRGGGSREDLSAFDDERVVRAVATCPVPVVSAVGHEVDVSLTDLAADRRAATPTAAGEMVVPVRADLAAVLAKEERRLRRELAVRLASARQELDQLALRADYAVDGALAGRRRRLAAVQRRIQALHPRAVLLARRAELREVEAALHAAMAPAIERRRRRFADLASRLGSLSPLSVLERGYALATAGGHVVTSASQVDAGDPLSVRLARGRVTCRVEETHPDDEDER